MKRFAPALALGAIVACSPAFAVNSAPAPFFAAAHAVAASQAHAKPPATGSFWDQGTCVGTCTASCDSGTEEHYDVTSDYCCAYYLRHTCADGSFAGSVEWSPTFSTGAGGCFALICS